MLLDALRSLVRGKAGEPAADQGDTAPLPAPGADDVDPLQLAACALLLDIAHADGEFSPVEREHIAHAVQRHFALEPEAGDRLIELAAREHSSSIDQFRFTARLREEYDLGQKMVLAEIMWSLVLSDGEISEHEAYLTRKISNLLDIAPGYLSKAKASAEKGLG